LRLQSDAVSYLVCTNIAFFSLKKGKNSVAYFNRIFIPIFFKKFFIVEETLKNVGYLSQKHNQHQFPYFFYVQHTSKEPPLLVGLLANTDPAARKYAEWTGKACRADGLRYELRLIDSPIDVENALNSANDDPAVHGIIVYYPIFGQVESFSGTSQDDYLRDTISYKCDVEGLCHTYRTNLYRNTRFLDYPTKNLKCVLPCTALSVVKILESIPNCYDKSKPIGRHMEGQVVTVINRSEVVGRPLAAMLANDGADVYSVDINSIYLFRAGGRLEKVSEDETPESVVRKSTVVIAGVPTKSYKLPTEWIQPNTTVVNVASFKNVDEESLLQVPGVTYVPMVSIGFL